MKNYYLIQIDILCGEIFIEEFKAKDVESAWEIVEDEYSGNYTKDILLDEFQFETLGEMICKNIQERKNETKKKDEDILE